MLQVKTESSSWDLFEKQDSMQRRREMEMGYLQENHHCCKAHCGVIQTFRTAGNEAAIPIGWFPNENRVVLSPSDTERMFHLEL